MYIFLSFIFGTLIGSFLNVVILRLPKEETLSGRSHCVHCGHVLTAGELIPIFRYLWLGGKCRSCKTRISPRYAIIEALTGLLFAATLVIAAPQDLTGVLLLARDWFIVSILLLVFVIDLEHMLILDRIIFPSAILVLMSNIALDLVQKNGIGWHSAAISGLLGALVGPLPFYVVWYLSRGRWMGFGDVKLLILLGMILGLPRVFVGVFIAVILGGLVAVGLLWARKAALKTKIAFGTFLSVGALAALFWGQPLLSWYLAMIGF